MINPDFNKLLKEKQSRYALVTAVAKRARDISQVIEDGRTNDKGVSNGDDLAARKSEEMSKRLGTAKPVTYALEELISGKMQIKDPVYEAEISEDK